MSYMLDNSRLTKAVRRGEVSPVPVKNPQRYVTPRRNRDQQCGCGFPITPCVRDKKWHDDEPTYRGNYCAAIDE